MFDGLTDVVDWLFGGVADGVSAVAGWAWEKVVQGIYQWLASGLVYLIEWVWSGLDSATTPQVTRDWFRNELAAQVAVVALAVTVALMLASAIQAALAGRPEQIGDAVRQGVWSIVASALTLTAVDILVRVVDETAAVVWEIGRPDLVRISEVIMGVLVYGGPIAATFVAVLCMLLGFAGLLGLVLALSMRMALIYLVAALAPLVWSSSVLPILRGSARRLIHVLVALIVSKLAIVISLVVSVKLIANIGGDPDTEAIANDTSAAIGTLVAGFTCFVVAAISPWVLYKLMPTIEGAVVASGIAGGLGRGALSVAQAGMIGKALVQSAAARPVPGQGPPSSDPGGSDGGGPTGGGPGLGPPSPGGKSPGSAGGGTGGLARSGGGVGSVARYLRGTSGERRSPAGLSLTGFAGKADATTSKATASPGAAAASQAEAAASTGGETFDPVTSPSPAATPASAKDVGEPGPSEELGDE
jgi:hypothetical protein